MTDPAVEDKAVHDILMCVIGETLIYANAKCMFGQDFDSIINKYKPLLKSNCDMSDDFFMTRAKDSELYEKK